MIFHGILRGFPRPAPGSDASLRRLIGQHTVILTAMTYYSERKQQNQQRKNIHGVKSGHEFPKVFSQWSPSGHTTSGDVCEMLPSREAH